MQCFCLFFFFVYVCLWLCDFVRAICYVNLVFCIFIVVSNHMLKMTYACLSILSQYYSFLFYRFLNIEVICRDKRVVCLSDSMVCLTTELIARGCSGYTKRRRDESAQQFFKRLTHVYLENKGLSGVVRGCFCHYYYC